MRFPVPKFVDVEDKIFGPLTLKQFIYLAGAVGMSIVFYLILPIFVSVILIVAVGGLAVALAFYRPNNRPFVRMLESMFKYFTSSKMYTWKKRPKQAKTGGAGAPLPPGFELPKLSNSKLKDISWNVDVKDDSPGGAEQS